MSTGIEERLTAAEDKLTEVLKLLRQIVKDKKGRAKVAKYQAKCYAKRREAQLNETSPGIKNPDRNKNTYANTNTN